MAWTNWGFDGTINEAQWAELAPLLGNGYVAKDASSCVTTPVSGQRKVSVSAGTLFGDGILSKSDAAEQVTLTTPANGQWYVIALKRTWASNTVALVAVAGATTTTTTPTAPPSTLPTLASNPGVETEQPIAWAWCNSANTTVVVYDMRKMPQKQANPESVANVNDRDAKFSSPVQGTTVWRNDLGILETYYSAYNISTNPAGKTPAGWYRQPGQIAQVQYKTTSTNVSTNSSSNVSTGLSFSFTPLYSNSRIIVQVVINGITRDDGTAARFQLTKDSANVQTLYTFAGYNIASFGQYFSVSGQYSEISGNTNARTYDVALARSLGSGSALVGVQANDATSSIIIWEVTQ